MTDNSWQPDGWDLAARIGVLTSHADVGPESELRAMAPPMIGIYAARVPFGAMAAGGQMDLTIPLAPVRAFAEPPHVDQAAGLLAAAPLDAIGFGFTSSAYVIGAVGEEQMIRRLESLTRGIPVVTPCAATVRALELLGAGRIALIDVAGLPGCPTNPFGPHAIAQFDLAGSRSCRRPPRHSDGMTATRPPVDVAVRPVRFTDVEQLHHLRGQSGAIAFTLALPSERAEDTRRWLERLTSDDHVLVAELDGRVVGIVGLHVRSGKQRHSASVGMVVADDFHGRGIGHRLLDAALYLADDHLGLLRVDLEVLHDNRRAIALYERSGFEQEGRHRRALRYRGGLADVLSFARLAADTSSEPPCGEP